MLLFPNVFTVVTLMFLDLIKLSLYGFQDRRKAHKLMVVKGLKWLEAMISYNARMYETCTSDYIMNICRTVWEIQIRWKIFANWWTNRDTDNGHNITYLYWQNCSGLHYLLKDRMDNTSIQHLYIFTVTSLYKKYTVLQMYNNNANVLTSI